MVTVTDILIMDIHPIMITILIMGMVTEVVIMVVEAVVVVAFTAIITPVLPTEDRILLVVSQTDQVLLA